MTQKYELTLNTRQATVLRNALELYVRLCLGQMERLAELGTPIPMPDDIAIGKLTAARNLIVEAKQLLTGFHENASHGIGSDKISDEPRVAYDILQVVRHRLAHDNGTTPSWSVDLREPMQFSKEEFLSTIRKGG